MTWSLFSDDELDPAVVDEALRHDGGFFVRPKGASDIMRSVLMATRWFFELPHAEKMALSTGSSPHFRGWSEMHNERDWREQLHLGRESESNEPIAVAYQHLDGPNLWPNDADWRDIVAAYANITSDLGARVLKVLARALAADPGRFTGGGRDGYLIMKLIGYHPQSMNGALRSGVAPHVDFSWLTVNLVEGAGLEIRRPDGSWSPIEPVPGALWLHAGELLEHATKGRYSATPHRVFNLASDSMRVSIPVFINPPLDFIVQAIPKLLRPHDGEDRVPRALEDDPHVHRVLPTRKSYEDLHFGDEEWNRKGLGRWCAQCCSENAEGRRDDVAVREL